MSTYIKLSDVQKILSKTSDKYQSEYTGGWIVSKIQEDINSLPSISFEEIIKEMIEENQIQHNGQDDYNYSLGFQEALKELLNKLPCRGGAFILPLEKGYECLCGATYEHYMCRCTEGCGLENQIDVKGNLIKSNK